MSTFLSSHAIVWACKEQVAIQLIMGTTCHYHYSKAGPVISPGQMLKLDASSKTGISTSPSRVGMPNSGAEAKLNLLP